MTVTSLFKIYNPTPFSMTVHTDAEFLETFSGNSPSLKRKNDFNYHNQPTE